MLYPRYSYRAGTCQSCPEWGLNVNPPLISNNNNNAPPPLRWLPKWAVLM